LYRNPGSVRCINNAITIMTYCAETDPQAQRLIFILTAFRDVVAHQVGQPHPPRFMIHSEDPMASFFGQPQGPATIPAIKTDGSIGEPASGLTGQVTSPVRTRKSSIDDTAMGMHGPLTGGSLGGADDSSGEEAIDFDAFWNWPQSSAGNANADGQGINDSVVPLFGISDISDMT
jgi:hypothetical protein